MHKYSMRADNIDLEATVHAKLLRLVGSGKKVLECGCATGYISKVLKERYSCEVTGIELLPDAAKEAEKYCKRVLVGDLEEMDFTDLLKDERFDVITFGDVLEHLKYPADVLSKMRPLLAEEGYILASIPNIAHLSVLLELLNGRFDYRSSGLLDESHLRFFTKKSILSLFTKSGFKIVHWDRMILSPEDTEFQTPMEEFPHSLLEFVGTGSEALTYQFVVKAMSYIPGNALSETQRNGESSALLELKYGLEEVEKEKKRLAAKERQIEAIYDSWSWRITAPLRKLYEIITGTGRKAGK
jgi:O-antigen biosynthesis protein